MGLWFAVLLLVASSIAQFPFGVHFFYLFRFYLISFSCLLLISFFLSDDDDCTCNETRYVTANMVAGKCAKGGGCLNNKCFKTNDQVPGSICFTTRYEENEGRIAKCKNDAECRTCFNCASPYTSSGLIADVGKIAVEAGHTVTATGNTVTNLGTTVAGGAGLGGVVGAVGGTVNELGGAVSGLGGGKSELDGAAGFQGGAATEQQGGF